MSVDQLLSETPFLATGDLAVIAPQWVRQMTESPDPVDAARAWYVEHEGPFVGRRYVVDDVVMLEVSFTRWDDARREQYVLLGALQGKRPGDLTPFMMRPVGATGLLQATFLLPADGCYSYAFSAPDPRALAEASGHARLGILYAAKSVDDRNPAALPANGMSVWQGPDFPAHPAVTDPAPRVADDLTHLTVIHADGRERDVWLHRAPSGTRRTVVLFDGDAWRDLGIGAAQWQAAGYDANLVLMSSMEAGDRTPDLTQPERAASTLRDVLEAAGRSWQLTLRGEDVILVGQSFGGLAVVSTVLGHPEQAAEGVCISGSFFVRAGEPFPQDLDQVGTHRQALGSLRDPVGRIVLISGRDEPIAPQSLAFLEEARAAGVDIGAFRQMRGTHDYAWWRHAIFHGLDHLLTDNSSVA